MFAMKITKLILIILPIFIYNNLAGQPATKLDSLLSDYKKTTTDSTRCRIMLAIGNQYENQFPDSAIQWYNNMLSLAANNETKNEIFLFYVCTAMQYCGWAECIYKGNFQKASDLSDKAIAKFDALVKKSRNKEIQRISKKGKAGVFRTLGIVSQHKGNYDKAMDLYLKALKLSEEAGDKKGMAGSYNNLGIAYKDLGNFEKAIVFYKQSLKIREEFGDKKGMSGNYNNIGNSLRELGNFDNAIESYLKALKIREELKDKKGMAETYLCLGIVHNSQGNYDKALEFYNKTLQLAEELGNKKGISDVYNSIGVTLKEKGENDKAMESHFKSLKIAEELNYKMGIAQSYTNIGINYQDKYNYKNAIDYYQKSLVLYEELGSKAGLAIIYGNIGYLHLLLSDSSRATVASGHIKSAVEYGLKALSLSREMKALPYENFAAKTLMYAYRKQGNLKKAIEFSDLFITTNDSMFKAEKTKALANAEAKFNAEKKQKEIELLNKDKALQKTEIEKQTTQKYAFIAGFTLMLLLAFVIFRGYRQKRKDNILLKEQKHEIEQKNETLNQQNEEISAQRDEIEAQRDLVTHQKEHIEEIHKEVTDSINYAERIQRSFLATKELLDENLRDYFVLFKPKDVVSGDFYWAGTLSNDNFALITADSTGHGVPGAIMSILNISSLEKAVEQNIYEPSEILNFTRKAIIERLKKDGSPEGGKDGMDASLICFNFPERKFIYAAANNPVWVIRENILIELNPDKMPVGKHDKDQNSFTQNEFIFQKDDIIYLATDGFEDQFGGPKGKKFLSKKLKQFLVENCQKPMAEQKVILENTIEDWKNGYEIKCEQVDDITVMGIKIF